MTLSTFLLAGSCLVQSGLLSGVTAVLVRESDASSYDDYVVLHGRGWEAGTEEYAVHHRAFQRRLEFITAHNANPNRRWTAGLNHLSDNTEQEFSMLLGSRRYNRGGGAGDFSLLEMHEKSNVKLLEEVNWGNLTMAHAVPDQSSCGSCWALATVSMMDAHAEIHGMINKSFSPQHLVDCTPNPRECGGSGGCQGATVELAMKYIEKKGLLDTSEVPYMAEDGECKNPLDKATAATFLELGHNEVHFVPHRNRHGHSGLSSAYGSSQPVWGSIALKNWVTLPSNKAGPLMRAVLEGPVAISVGASSWHSYINGVFDGCVNDTVIDHAVTLFGYGLDTNTSTNYWNIRNSWGPRWGEDGYIRILRSATVQEDDALCGIDHEPEKGIECKPYPKQVKVCGMCGLLYDSVAVTFHNTSESGSGSGSVTIGSSNSSATTGSASATGISASSSAVTSF